MYYENLNKDLKEYFSILEPDFPKWLNEYINTKRLLCQQYISVACGTNYSKLFEKSSFFSTLDHSIAVALIVWHLRMTKFKHLLGFFMT